MPVEARLVNPVPPFPTGRTPLIPEVNETPVQFDKVPDAGVPRTVAPLNVFAPEMVCAVVKVANAPAPAIASTEVAVPPAPPVPIP